MWSFSSFFSNIWFYSGPSYYISRLSSYCCLGFQIGQQENKSRNWWLVVSTLVWFFSYCRTLLLKLCSWNFKPEAGKWRTCSSWDIRHPFSPMVVVAVHARDHNLEANLKKEKRQTKAASYSVWGDFETLFIIRVLDSVSHFGDQVSHIFCLWMDLSEDRKLIWS